MAKGSEKSTQNKIKRLEDQFYRFDGNKHKQHNLQQRVLTLKNTG